MPCSRALTTAPPFPFPMTGPSQPRSCSATTTMQAHSQPQSHSFPFPSAANAVATNQEKPTSSHSPSLLPSTRSASSSYNATTRNASVGNKHIAAHRVSSSTSFRSSSSLPNRPDAALQLSLAKQDDDDNEHDKERSGSGIFNATNCAASPTVLDGHEKSASSQSQSKPSPSESPRQVEHERQPTQPPLPRLSAQSQLRHPAGTAPMMDPGQLVGVQTSTSAVPSASEVPNKCSILSQSSSPDAQSLAVLGGSKVHTAANVVAAAPFSVDAYTQCHGMIDTAHSCINERSEQITNGPLVASNCSADSPLSKPVSASSSAQVLATASGLVPTQDHALLDGLHGASGAEEAAAIPMGPSNEPVPLPIPERNSISAADYQFSGVKHTTSIAQDTALLNSALEPRSGLSDFSFGRFGSTNPDVSLSADAIFGPATAASILAGPNSSSMYHEVFPLGTAPVTKVEALGIDAPAPRLVRFPENYTTSIFACNDGGPGLCGNEGQVSADEGGNAKAAPGSEPRIQAFAKLEFDDGHFYVNTYSLILGRDVRAAHAALQRAVCARERNRAARNKGRNARHPSFTTRANRTASMHATHPLLDASDHNFFMAESVVSDRGGIIGFDADVPQQPPAIVSWQSSNFSGGNKFTRPVLYMAPADFPPPLLQDLSLNVDFMQSDYDALAMQSLLADDGVKPVDTLSLLPSPDACPVIPIHPPASANHDDMLSLHKGISRKHVRIYYNFEKSVFEMEVMGRNGAFIGPDWLSPGQTRPLSSGDYIQISGVRVRFVLPDEPVEGYNFDAVTEPPAAPALFADDAMNRSIEGETVPASAMEKKKGKRKASDALLSDDEAEASTVTTGMSTSRSKKKNKRIKLKVSIPLSMAQEKAGEDEAKEQEKEEKESGEEERGKAEEKKKVKEWEEKEKQAQKEQVLKAQENQLQQQPQQQYQQQQDAEKAMEAAERAPSDSRPSIDTTPPASIVPDGTIVQQPQIPAKRRGPGRPPKDGIMSKRERAELAREQRMAAKREANGGITPPSTTSIHATDGKMKKGSPAFAAPFTPVGTGEMINMLPDAMTPAVRQEKERRKYNKRKKQDCLPGESTVFLSIENSTSSRFGDFGQVDVGSSGAGVMMTHEQSANKTLPPSSKKRKPSRSPSPNYPPESAYSAEDLAKPPYNYAVLIFDALSESQTPMTLKQIYRALKLKYPYFRFRCETEGWTSSVRHNLNGNSHLFEHAERDGKGWSWKLISGASVDKEKKRRPSPQPAPSHSTQHIAPSQTSQPQPIGASVATPQSAQCAAQMFTANATMNGKTQQRTALPFQFPPAATTSQYQNGADVQPQPPGHQPPQPPAQTTTTAFATSSNLVRQFQVPAALRGNFPPSFTTNSTSTYQSPYASAPPAEVLQQLRKANEDKYSIERRPPSMQQVLQQRQLQQPQQSQPLQRYPAPSVAPNLASNLPGPSPAPEPASAQTPVQNPPSATTPAPLPSANSSAGQASVPAPSHQSLPRSQSRPNLPSPRPVPPQPLLPHSAPLSASPTPTLAHTPPAPSNSVPSRPVPLSVPPSIHRSAPQPAPASVPQSAPGSVTPAAPNFPYNHVQYASSVPARGVHVPKTSMSTTVPAASAALPSTTVTTFVQTPAPAATTTTFKQISQQTPHPTASTAMSPLPPPPQPRPQPHPHAQAQVQFRAFPQCAAPPLSQIQPTQAPLPANHYSRNVSLDLANESACFIDRASAAVDNFESVLMEDADDQDYLRQVLRSARNRVLHGARESSFPGGEPKDEAVIIDAIRRIIGGLRE